MVTCVDSPPHDRVFLWDSSCLSDGLENRDVVGVQSLHTPKCVLPIWPSLRGRMTVHSSTYPAAEGWKVFFFGKNQRQTQIIIWFSKTFPKRTIFNVFVDDKTICPVQLSSAQLISSMSQWRKFFFAVRQNPLVTNSTKTQWGNWTLKVQV